MELWELQELIAQQSSSDQAYLEFLRVPSMSAGIYVIPAGGIDQQQPHSEDEIYYVLRGRGQILVGDEHQKVEAGTIIFVAAHVAHRFHSIIEDLTVLVLFAPAEYSAAPGPNTT